MLFYTLHRYGYAPTSDSHYSLFLTGTPILTIASILIFNCAKTINLGFSSCIITLCTLTIIILLSPNPSRALLPMSRGFPRSDYLRYTTLQDPRQSLIAILSAPPATATQCGLKIALARPYQGMSRLQFVLNDTVILNAQLDLNNPTTFSTSYTCSLFQNSDILSLVITQPVPDIYLNIAVVPLNSTIPPLLPLPKAFFAFEGHVFEGAPDPETGTISRVALLLQHERF